MSMYKDKNNRSKRNSAEQGSHIKDKSTNRIKKQIHCIEFDKLRQEMNKIYGSSKALEAEYIKNLQEQIYLLEIENNYIRQKALKATELQPKMEEEADKMINKLRKLQSIVDALELEIYRKDSHINILTQKYNKINDEIKKESEYRIEQKDIFTQDIMRLQSENDTLARDNARKDVLIEDLRMEMTRYQTNLHSAEDQIGSLRLNLSEESNRCKECEMELLAKKAEVHKFNDVLRSIENDFRDNIHSMEKSSRNQFHNKIQILEKEVSELKESLRVTFLQRDNYIEENAKLSRERAFLRKEVLEIQQKYDQAIEGRNRVETKYINDLNELKRLNKRETDLMRDNSILQKQLSIEKCGKNNIQNQPFSHASKNRLVSFSHEKCLDASHEEALEEIRKQREDKEVLIQHISALQRRIEDQTKLNEYLKIQVKQSMEREKKLKCPINTDQEREMMEFKERNEDHEQEITNIHEVAKEIES